MIAENGLARPGEILTCTDSHTCAGGAYNTAARDSGRWRSTSVMCTGRTWFQVAPTIRYELTGAKPEVVTGKDIFLHIAGAYGDATNHSLEFGGPGLTTVPMNDRRTIATQGARSRPTPDLPGRRALPRVPRRAHRPSYEPAPPGSRCAVRRGPCTVDLTTLEPYVARPGGVADNASPSPK